MKIPLKTLKNGFSLPLLSMGTWMIGGGVQPDPHCDEDLAIHSIQLGLQNGLTCIDSAEMYGDGYTEQLIGRAIRDFPRENLQIISKVSPQNLRYDDVLKALEGSLKRLQTDYLDVYLVHKPNSDIPLEETMRAMRHLKDQGLVRNIGVSNFSVATLQEAQNQLGLPIVLNQVHYNLMFREPELCGLLEYCQQNDIFLMAWRPLEKGIFATDCPLILQKIANKYGKSPAQTAINWLTAQENVVTLSTMRQAKNINENIAAVNWTLKNEDIEKLRTVFPGQKKVSNREPLL